MKKHLYLSFGTALLFLLSHNTNADNVNAIPQQLKIGYVNFDTAFSQEKEAQKYVKELEDEGRKILEAEQKANVDIQTKITGLQNLEEKARQTHQAAIGNEINTLTQKFEQQKYELKQKQEKIQVDLQKKNQLLVDSIAREKGLDLVMNAAMFVYVSDTIKKNDITANLIEKYNNAYSVKPEPVKKPVTAKPAPKPATAR